MSHRWRCLLPLICAAGLSVAAESPAPAGATVSKRQYENPKYKRMDLAWPGEPDREALVYVRFDITRDGKTTNVQLGEGGFHEQRFVDEALRAVRRATFEPARENGVNVEARGLIQPVNFSLGNVRGITAEFRRELENSRKFIKDGDYAGGHFHTQWMLSEKVRLGYEYAVLQAQLAHTHATMGNVDRAMEAAAFATMRTTASYEAFEPHAEVRPLFASLYLLPKETVASLLELRVRLALQNGLAMEALQAYYELAGLMKGETPPAMHQIANQLRLALDSNAPLVGRATVTERGYWRHPLYRRAFSLENVKGEVSLIRLECAGNERDLTYAAGATWTVPAKWENCQVSIKTEPGTSFQFVEYSREVATATP